MNRDEAIKIANDMAFMASIWIDDEGNEVNDLVKFAKLVAAKEREACAKVCDVLAEDYGKAGLPMTYNALTATAKEIRARGTQ